MIGDREQERGLVVDLRGERRDVDVLGLERACALSLLAGTTTPAVPTRSWQSVEPRNLAYLQAAAWFFDLDRMESARPLNMLARVPTGPIGIGVIPTVTPWVLVSALVFHEPLPPRRPLAGTERTAP